MGLAVALGVDVCVVGQHIAGGVGAARASADVHGVAAVVAGRRCVVTPIDGDRQVGTGGTAPAIFQCIGEDVDQGLAALTQRLDLRVVVIDLVAVAAVGLHHQAAVAAHKRVAEGAFGASAGVIAGANAGHCQIGAEQVDAEVDVSIDVAVVVEHIAHGVRPGRGVVPAAGLHRQATVGAGQRRLVLAAHEHRQFGQVHQSRQITGLVGEDVAAELQRAKPEDLGVGLVDRVAVTAVGGKRQGAVLACQGYRAGAGGGQGPACGLGAGAGATHGQLVTGVDITVVVEHIAAGITAGALIAVGHRQGDVVGGHRGVVASLNGHGQARRGTDAQGIDAAVDEDLGEGIVGGS